MKVFKSLLVLMIIVFLFNFSACKKDNGDKFATNISTSTGKGLDKIVADMKLKFIAMTAEVTKANATFEQAIPIMVKYGVTNTDRQKEAYILIQKQIKLNEEHQKILLNVTLISD